MHHIDHKRGDTLYWDVRVTEGASDVPVDITGWQMACQIRRLGVLVDDLAAVSVTPQAGRFALTLPAGDSQAWPVGYCEGDVQMTDPSGVRVSSSTIIIRVVEDLTQ